MKYEQAMSFHQGVAAVYDGNNWGFIDKTGKTKLPFKYSTPENDGFGENGLCKIEYKGYVDLRGTEYWSDELVIE